MNKADGLRLDSAMSSLSSRRGWSHGWPQLALGCALIGSAWALAGCGDGDVAEPNTQYGAKPVLPEPKQFLVPPMKVAPAGSWSPGETPAVASGLKIQALAMGLQHPRSLYVLPNGDILVVEANGPKAPVNRPKDLIMGWVQVFGGSAAPGGNRITLLRPASNGAPAMRTVFLDHLNSPFGVALIGNDLFVANTDAVVRYPYVDGETQISAPGTKLVDLPGGPIDHHWTKSLLASAAAMRGETLETFQKTRNAPGALHSVAGKDAGALNWDRPPPLGS